MIDRYLALLSSSWTDEAIAKLNRVRYEAPAQGSFNTRANRLSCIDQAQLTQFLSGNATVTGSGVCKVKGLGTCILTSGQIRTESGRTLSATGREILATDRQFTPLYPCEMGLSDEFAQFIVDLHNSSIEVRMAFFKRFGRPELWCKRNYDFFSTLYRFHRWTSNPNSHDYRDNPTYNNGHSHALNMTSLSTGNNPPWDDRSAFCIHEIVEPDVTKIRTEQFLRFWKSGVINA